MKKVVFCFYPLYVHYNHGIALLSALCKQQGIDTELYMLDSPEKFRIFLGERERYVVCFSAVIERDYRMSLPFMHIAQDEGYVVMFGGVYAKRQGVDLSDCPADFICRGEGETLPDFLLGHGRELFDRPMVCEDINALPLPDYELFKDIPFDRRLSFIDSMKVLPYYSSRGCPYQCSFCEVRLQQHLGAAWPRIRYKVGEELAYLADKYQPDIFFIGDETLPYYDSK